MKEWILIVTMHTTGTPGTIHNFDAEVVSGFTNEKSCLAAGQVIGTSISEQTVNHRAAEGMDLDSMLGRLVTFVDCMEIVK